LFDNKSSNGRLSNWLREHLARHFSDNWDGHICGGDLIELVWPYATAATKEHIWNSFRQFDRIHGAHVNTPPVLPPHMYHDLRTLHKKFDEMCGGVLTFDALHELAFESADEVEVLQSRRMFDINTDGLCDVDEFCEMMCPSGYRATSHSTVATMPDSTRIVLDSISGDWRQDVMQMSRQVTGAESPAMSRQVTVEEVLSRVTGEEMLRQVTGAEPPTMSRQITGAEPPTMSEPSSPRTPGSVRCRPFHSTPAPTMDLICVALVEAA